MKKILFALVALFGCATLSFAQVNFIATLQHEGEFTQYYGSEAFTSAYNAAATGDTITLSGGKFFFSGNFEKGITVRGTGTTADLPTELASAMNFYSKDANLTATFEGVRFNDYVSIVNSFSEQGQGKINFIKCFFARGLTATINSSSYSIEKGPETRFTNCVISDRLYFATYSYAYFTFANSYVKNPRCENNFNSKLTVFENCVIEDYGSYATDYLSKAYFLSFNNCIIVSTGSSSSLPSTATAQNCLSINNSSCFSNTYNNGTNWNVSKASDVFKTYTSGSYSSDNYALTDEAASTYIGTDGTQIGVNGGYAPFTQTVQYPVVTTLKANQTTKEGILNIEVGIDE